MLECTRRVKRPGFFGDFSPPHPMPAARVSGCANQSERCDPIVHGDRLTRIPPRSKAKLGFFS